MVTTSRSRQSVLFFLFISPDGSGRTRAFFSRRGRLRTRAFFSPAFGERNRLLIGGVPIVLGPKPARGLNHLTRDGEPIAVVVSLNGFEEPSTFCELVVSNQVASTEHLPCELTSALVEEFFFGERWIGLATYAGTDFLELGVC